MRIKCTLYDCNILFNAAHYMCIKKRTKIMFSKKTKTKSVRVSTPCACLVHVIWILILGFKSIITGFHTKKMMFGTKDLSEDWNPNLNFMRVPCQIWAQPFTCFWIQAGFKSGLNSCGSQFITVIGPTFFFSPHFLSLSSSTSLLLSPLLSGISRPLHYRRQTKKTQQNKNKQKCNKQS